jgi:hypothetical protein
MSHGGLKRARSWKRRIQPKEAYSSPGLLYSEAGENAWLRQSLRPSGRGLFEFIFAAPADLTQGQR